MNLQIHTYIHIQCIQTHTHTLYHTGKIILSYDVMSSTAETKNRRASTDGLERLRPTYIYTYIHNNVKITETYAYRRYLKMIKNNASWKFRPLIIYHTYINTYIHTCGLVSILPRKIVGLLGLFAANFASASFS